MANLSVGRYRYQLEAQLEREDVKTAISDLRKTHPIFSKYPTIEDLMGLCSPGIRNYEDVDSVLTTLLAEIKRETTLFPLLNLMFWTSLVRLFCKKRKSAPDPDELFLRVQVDFFHTAVSYPLDRRPTKIDTNLFYDTMKKVTRWQREEARFREQHEEWIEKRKEKIGQREEWVSPYAERSSIADLQVTDVFPEEMDEYLLDLVYRKVINNRQRDLILDVDVYRRMSEKEWALARGFSYATVRSWHFRAVTAIQKHVNARHEQEGDTE